MIIFPVQYYRLPFELYTKNIAMHQFVLTAGSDPNMETFLNSVTEMRDAKSPKNGVFF